MAAHRACWSPLFEKIRPSACCNHAKVDPDLDPLRDDPRFKAMVAAAEARLATAGDSSVPPAPH